MKKYFKFIITVSLIVFIILTIMVLTKDNLIIDNYIYNFVSNYITNKNTYIFKTITYLGSSLFLIYLVCISFLTFKNKKISLFIIINLLLVTGFNFFLKFIFQRNRPTILRLIDEKGYSYPSGHSMVSLAFYGYLIYLIYKYVSNKYLKVILITILSILIFLIGISRIYLGVHFPSDVIGGFILAFIYLIIFIKIANKYLYEK